MASLSLGSWQLVPRAPPPLASPPPEEPLSEGGPLPINCRLTSSILPFLTAVERANGLDPRVRATPGALLLPPLVPPYPLPGLGAPCT